MTIPNERELQQSALNDSSDIDFKDFIKIYKKYTAEPYSFLLNDTTLPSNISLRFSLDNMILNSHDSIICLFQQIFTKS